MPYGPEGKLSAKLCVVAEAPAANEMRIGRPLVGPSGQLFDQLSTQSKLSRRFMYITNVCDTNITNIKMYISATGKLTSLGFEAIQRLTSELEGCEAHVIMCMGNLALKALTGEYGILKWRGSILEATLPSITGKKVIPTIHPAATFRGQYLWRYNILNDMQRVKRELEYPEIRLPDYNFNLDPTFEDCIAWLAECSECKAVSVDIEIIGRHVSRISFALDHVNAISIPFDNTRWTVEEEAQLWLAVQAVLGDPAITKIGQNFTFDSTFLMTQSSIITRGPIEDTMVAHHTMYPDFPKGLGFLTSLHTDQRYYKGMVRHGAISKSNG